MSKPFVYGVMALCHVLEGPPSSVFPMSALVVTGGDIFVRKYSLLLFHPIELLSDGIAHSEDVAPWEFKKKKQVTQVLMHEKIY